MPVTVKVRDVMDTNVYAVNASVNVREVLKTMHEKGVWSVIVEEKGLPLGVITERDVLRRCIIKGLDPGKVLAKEIMSSPLITIGPDEPIGEAMRIMAEKGVRRVYVVEGGKIIGRVTQTNACANLLNIVLTLHNIRYQL